MSLSGVEAASNAVDMSSYQDFKSFFPKDEAGLSIEQAGLTDEEKIEMIEEIAPYFPEKLKPYLRTTLDVLPQKFFEIAYSLLNREAAMENWQRFGAPVLPGAAEVAYDLGEKVVYAYDQAAEKAQEAHLFLQQAIVVIREKAIAQHLSEEKQLEEQRAEYEVAIETMASSAARGSLMEGNKEESVGGFRKQLTLIEDKLQTTQASLQELLGLSQNLEKDKEVVIYTAADTTPQRHDPGKAIPVAMPA